MLLLKSRFRVFYFIAGLIFFSLSCSAVERTWVSDPFSVNDSIKVDDRDLIPVDTRLVLKGIWKRGSKYKAMIDGEIVTEGDVLDDYKIKRIFVDKVWVITPRGETKQIAFN